ncbi:MAG: iron complex transport system substrate-binding protein [Motiliproteus sp.]|jgi:iron complex transport system substrate-binding protein
MTRTLLKTVAATFLALLPISGNAEAVSSRLISTDAGSSELIFALGLEQSLIAVDVTTQLPKGHRRLPNIGYHRNLSAEGLLSLNPTAVIGSEYMGPDSVINALTLAKVTLIRLPSAKDSEQLRKNIIRLAGALDQPDRGQQLSSRLDKQLITLKSRALREEQIAFILSVDSTSLRLAGKGSGGDALIQLMGGNNVADFNNYQTVSAESLMVMQPSIIIVAGKTIQTAVVDLMAANPILKHSPAGNKQQIIAVDGSTLVAGLSISAVEEALRLVTQLNSPINASINSSINASINASINTQAASH